MLNVNSLPPQGHRVFPSNISRSPLSKQQPFNQVPDNFANTLPATVQHPISNISEALYSQARGFDGASGNEGVQQHETGTQIQPASTAQALRDDNNSNSWNWDFQGTKPRVILSIDHTGMGTKYNTPQLLHEMMQEGIKPNVTVFPMWRGGGGAMPKEQQKLMDQLLTLQNQYPSIQIGVHPDNRGGTEQLYNFLNARTDQPIPFSYHGSNASFRGVQQQKVLPPYLEGALQNGQLVARSTMSDKSAERNSYDLPVIPSHWGQKEMQNALIANAKADKPSLIFFHSHETRQAPWTAPYQNLMNAIQQGKIQTAPFPQPPNWAGNPKPEQ